MADTDTTRDDLRERLSRLEGGYQHLATKADVAKLEGRVVRLESRLQAGFPQSDPLLDPIDAGFDRMDAGFERVKDALDQFERRLVLKTGILMIVVFGAAGAFLALTG